MKITTDANCFLALRLASGAIDRLAAVSGRLQAWGLAAAWTNPADFHITLHFLGKLSVDEVELIPEAIDLVANHLRRPSGLRFAGLGATGGRDHPRAVFAALSDPSGACAGLAADLAESLGEDGTFKPPHVTVCRPVDGPASGPGGTWTDLLTAHGEADWGPCAITHLALCRSGPGTPRYRELRKWDLAGPG
jgi:2'-5' RNA ligase